MAFEPHPWFIGLEGVEHSAEVARMLAWGATNGATGIIKPTDLQVRAQTVPGPSVRIMPGGFVAESTYAGAAQQSYIERAPTATDLEVPPTGSSGARTRYVVGAILDPDYPGGGTAPSVPNDGAYSEPRLVTSLNQAYPLVPLARINQPANTSAITNAMITDLRELANPKRESVLHARPRLSGDSWPSFSRTTVDGGEIFPGSTIQGNGIINLPVPSWANRMIIQAHWLGVRYAANTNPVGQMWIEYGDEYRPWTWSGKKQYEYGTQHFNFDSPGANNNTMRTNWMVHDAVPVPAKFRGKDITFAFKAGYNHRDHFGSVTLDGLSGVSIEVTFAQVALDVDTI